LIRYESILNASGFILYVHYIPWNEKVNFNRFGVDKHGGILYLIRAEMSKRSAPEQESMSARKRDEHMGLDLKSEPTKAAPVS
jgi:hypothetical protein